MLGNVSINFLSHANFVQYDLILRSFLLVLFCFFLFHRKRNACSHVHHLSQVGVGKWILPGFDQGLNFLAAIFLPWELMLQSPWLERSIHLSSALQGLLCPRPLISYFWFHRWLKRWNKLLELKISQQICGCCCYWHFDFVVHWISCTLIPLVNLLRVFCKLITCMHDWMNFL